MTGTPNAVTLIVPYYRNPAMLRLQDETWRLYPPELRVIVVDDGSPADPADAVLPVYSRAALLRIETDIAWNRNGARNLGSHAAETDWLLHLDVDHLLLPEGAWELVYGPLDPKVWYRFRRYRVGAADETRRKDELPDDAPFGRIKWHVDSFLCTHARYWSAGGYDEDYSGSLGGSAPFLEKLQGSAPCKEHPDATLRVHTRHAVPDAPDIHLSRDRSRYKRLRAEKRAQGDPKPTDWLRFPWTRIR